jgi:hypothetical protein
MNEVPDIAAETWAEWVEDWNLAASELFDVNLDKEQKEILHAIQHNNMVSVASGTARGKDFVAAVAAICFMFFTPKFDDEGHLIENTKVALTAPTGRQIQNIMYPEITRLYAKAKKIFPIIPGRLTGNDIRTDYDEWFLTGFKADDHNQEAWSGFHAVNTMFVVTEASGIPEATFSAIEGNLQGNSKILIVFNPNTPLGYAARSQKSKRWIKFRLDGLTAPNVMSKKMLIPGQVDFEWVKDKVINWCTPINILDFDKGEGDFEWEGKYYRPNDLFRVKVQGLFPKISEDVLIPLTWVEIARERWRKTEKPKKPLSLGVDVAGMGTDNTKLCPRYDNYVDKIETYFGNGKAEHMKVAGIVANYLKTKSTNAYIDTIGEGAGVYSRLIELNYNNAYSCKFSENANGLTDITGVYEFMNMRAYLYWAVRDWLNPANNTEACLPDSDDLTEELTEIKYKIQSNGKILIEPKEDLKKRLKRSPDEGDALANSFYPNKRVAGMSAQQVAGLL